MGCDQPAQCQHTLRQVITTQEPTDPKYDLRSSVVPRAHYRAVILVIESRAAKVDEVDLRREQHLPKLRTSRCQGATRRDVTVVRKGLVGVVQQ